MQVTVHGFLYHKKSESFEDCYDRFSINTAQNKFAISDGVSRSFFPGIWARLLVEAFVDLPGKVDFTNIENFRALQRRWTNEVLKRANRPDQKYHVKKFFAEGRPAAATFVGLHFNYDSNDPMWMAYALGDSYLFYVPSSVDRTPEYDEIVRLSSNSDLEFDNFPDFFDSIRPVNKGRIRIKSGMLRAGTFYLMTDALAEWFLHNYKSAIEEIQNWNSQEVFQQRIDELRESNLQDDDCSILVITISEDNEPGINYSGINLTNIDELSGYDFLPQQTDEDNKRETNTSKREEQQKSQVDQIFKSIDRIQGSEVGVSDTKSDLTIPETEVDELIDEKGSEKIDDKLVSNTEKLSLTNSTFNVEAESLLTDEQKGESHSLTDPSRVPIHHEDEPIQKKPEWIFRIRVWKWNLADLLKATLPSWDKSDKSSTESKTSKLGSKPEDSRGFGKNIQDEEEKGDSSDSITDKF